nr:PREDICTED: uncharacterized protein LOC109036435 [Bemisia tabaci]
MYSVSSLLFLFFASCLMVTKLLSTGEAAASTMNYKVNETAVIKRVKLEASKGRPALQYRIQLIDEPLFKEALAFMNEHFVLNNNLMKSLAPGVAPTEPIEDDDEEPGPWEMALSEGISLAAILEDDQGTTGSMIACYMLGIERKGEVFSLPEGQDIPEFFRYIGKTLEDVEAKADVYTIFNCTSYVAGYGLATAPKYQRRGIGEEMLRARAQVCRITDTPVSAAVFTGEASQKLAKKCGYQTLAELDLTTYRIDGKLIYPNPEWPVIKWMAIRYF